MNDANKVGYYFYNNGNKINIAEHSFGLMVSVTYHCYSIVFAENSGQTFVRKQARVIQKVRFNLLRMLTQIQLKMFRVH